MSCSLRFPADVTDAPPLMWGAMQSGQVFGEGEYEIVSSAPIGKGSGGTVYRGSRRATNTPVAVKCIDRLEVDCDPQKVQQLEREMNIAIKLRHQNIVNLLDVKFEEEVRAYSKKALVRLRLILQPSDATICWLGQLPWDDGRHSAIPGHATPATGCGPGKL